MGMYDLTTLQACKLWLGYDDTKNDIVVSSEIPRVSSMIMGFLNGPAFVKTTRTDIYNGKNTSRLTLRNSPVLAVSNLTIGTTVIPPNPTPPVGAGFLLEPWDGSVPARIQALSLNGYNFYQGSQNISVTYTTGYVQTETQTIGPTLQLTPLQASGICVADAGVTYVNGTPLVAVAATPAVGQYIPPSPTAGSAGALSYYQFNATDAGQAVVLSYSFVPWAVEMVAKDLVGERVSYRSRIGLRSKNLGGQETMSYDINTMPKWAQISLQPFLSTVPV